MEKPEWVIVSIARAKNGKEHGIELGTCKRCGETLYAALFTVLNTSTDETQALGNTCVKHVTGKSVAQLAAGMVDYAASERAEKEAADYAAAVQAWELANKEVLAFIERKVKEEHENYLDQLRKDPDAMFHGGNFWGDMHMKVQEYHTLTQGQAAFIALAMSRNESADLPKPGAKVKITGEVVACKIQSVQARYGEKKTQVSVTVRDENDVDHWIRLTSGTKSYGNFMESKLPDDACTYVKLSQYSGNERFPVKKGNTVTIFGSVKGSKPGLVFLTRGALKVS